MRRGSVAIEFALTAPVLVLFAAGIVDWGAYSRGEFAAREATRACARTGVQTALADEPETEAVAVGMAALAAAGLDTTNAVVEASRTGESPDHTLTCAIEVPFAPLVGIIPGPPTHTVTLTMRMEEQP